MSWSQVSRLVIYNLSVNGIYSYRGRQLLKGAGVIFPGRSHDLYFVLPASNTLNSVHGGAVCSRFSFGELFGVSGVIQKDHGASGKGLYCGE